MQWLMLQQQTPADFVIASGKQQSVRKFIQMSAEALGISLEFSGEGEQEIATVSAIEPKDGLTDMVCKVGDVIVRVDPKYYRPTEVDTLLGDASLAREKLGWVTKISLQEMVEEMIASDLVEARNRRLISEHNAKHNGNNG